MSCNPPCCKREPDGRCPYCYSAQEWAMQLPPDEIIRVAEDEGSPGQPWGRNYLLPDLLKDGTGDAVLGECGSRGKRDGADGYDSHTYVGSARDPGFEENVPRTEVGDSIPRPIPTLDNIITNQIIGDKLYGITRVRPRKVRSIDGSVVGGQRTVAPFIGEGSQVWGRFHVPDWVFLDKSYTKTGKFRFGLDRAGPDDLFARPSDDEWYAGIGDGSRYYNGHWAHRLQTFARCTFDFINGTGLVRTDTASFMFLNGRLPSQFIGPGHPYGPISIPVINNDGITNERDFDGVSLNDRRVFMRMKDRRIGAYWPLLWDTGLTLGDVFDSGIFFEINVTQKDGPVLPDGSFDFGWHFDVTYRIPQSGFEIQEEKSVTPIRCFSGGIYLSTTSGYSRTYHNTLQAGPYEGVFKAETQFDTFDVCNGDPSWWIDDVNAGLTHPSSKTIAALGWIQNLEVADGNYADTSYLVVRGFTHESALGEIKKAVSFLDYDEPSIPSGETITLGDVDNGDLMRLILDNPAEETVEVTSVTFDDPWLKTVSDSDPTLLPYTVVNLLFTVDHTVADGEVDITITHDANNEFIPSPWVITLNAELGVDPGGGGPGGGGPPD